MIYFQLYLETRMKKTRYMYFQEYKAFKHNEMKKYIIICNFFNKKCIL